MQSMTIEQLRAASNAGGVSDVTLKGQGGAFLVEIATRSGSGAVLSKARSTEPRRFGNPLAALKVLRDIGITVGKFDASEYDPTDKEPDAGNRGRATPCAKRTKPPPITSGWPPRFRHPLTTPGRAFRTMRSWRGWMPGLLATRRQEGSAHEPAVAAARGGRLTYDEGKNSLSHRLATDSRGRPRQHH